MAMWLSPYVSKFYTSVKNQSVQTIHKCFTDHIQPLQMPLYPNHASNNRTRTPKSARTGENSRYQNSSKVLVGASSYGEMLIYGINLAKIHAY